MIHTADLAGAVNETMDLRFNTLSLCFEEKVQQNYYLEDPPVCNDIEPQKTTKFTADVFAPPPSQHAVDTTTCSLHSYTTKYQWFFFGSYYEKIVENSDVAVSPAECKLWMKRRVSTKWGRLRKTSLAENTYSTSNTPKPQWVWNDRRFVRTTNALMSDTTITFNMKTGDAAHPFDHLLVCEPSKGVCTSKKNTYIFKPFQPHCYGTQDDLKKNTTILAHSYKNTYLYQAPGLDLAFSSLIKCPQSVEACYSNRYKHVYCTTTHYTIVTNEEITNVVNDRKFGNQQNFSTNNDPRALLISQAISSLGTSMNYEIQTLKEELILLQCRNVRVMLTNLRATQYVNPSAALSVALNRQAFATMGSESLQEIACTPVRSILRPSLWVGNRLAARPIFEIEYRNKTRVAQLTNGGYLRWGLREFMPKHAGYMVFQIQKKTFVFLNGTLIEDGLPTIVEVGLPTSDISLPQINTDQTILANTLGTYPPPIGLDYLHSTLSALLEINRAQLTSLGINEDELC